MTPAAMVLPDRLERLMSDDFHLCDGPCFGAVNDRGMCPTQAVAWLAGEEPITHEPRCACRGLVLYVGCLGCSRLFAGHRDELKPYLPRLVGTRSRSDVALRRAFVAADYLVRVFVPAWLRRMNREEWARHLESLEPIDRLESAGAARAASRTILHAANADPDRSPSLSGVAYAAAHAAEDLCRCTSEVAIRCLARGLPEYAADYATDRGGALECLDRMIAVA